MRKMILAAAVCLTMELMAADTVSFAKVEKAPTTKNEELCELFKKKIADYKAKMRDDDYARATLASYETRAALYCEQ
jgi:hypothetical protein